MCSAEPVRLHPVIAAESGHYGDYVPGNTLLEDTSIWASPIISVMGDAPGWITYDMQEPHFVNQIAFRGRNDGQSSRDLILQSSEAQDGPWTDVLPFTTKMSVDHQEFDVPDVPRACRFWRVLMNTNHGQTSGNRKFVVVEMRFFGVRR